MSEVAYLLPHKKRKVSHVGHTENAAHYANDGRQQEAPNVTECIVGVLDQDDANDTTCSSSSTQDTLVSPEESNIVVGDTIVREPHDHDVLAGRGGTMLRHVGNKFYRHVCATYVQTYHAMPRTLKIEVVRQVIRQIAHQDPPGRFLEKSTRQGYWTVMAPKKVEEKTSQAMRDTTPARALKSWSMNNTLGMLLTTSGERNHYVEHYVPHDPTTTATVATTSIAPAPAPAPAPQQWPTYTTRIPKHPFYAPTNVSPIALPLPQVAMSTPPPPQAMLSYPPPCSQFHHDGTQQQAQIMDTATMFIPKNKKEIVKDERMEEEGQFEDADESNDDERTTTTTTAMATTMNNNTQHNTSMQIYQACLRFGYLEKDDRPQSRSLIF